MGGNQLSRKVPFCCFEMVQLGNYQLKSLYSLRKKGLNKVLSEMREEVCDEKDPDEKDGDEL